MANTKIKFYRSLDEPSNPINGAIWFNANDSAIRLYRDGNWEIYSSEVRNVQYANGILSISKYDTSENFTIDLSDISKISGLTEDVAEVVSKINELTEGLEENEKAWAGFLNEFNERLNNIKESEGLATTTEVHNYINEVLDWEEYD